MGMSPTLNVVETKTMSDGTEVVLEGPKAPLVPRAVAENRARLRALTVAGLEGVPRETVEQLQAGDLSRITEILVSEETNSGDMRFVVAVRGQ